MPVVTSWSNSRRTADGGVARRAFCGAKTHELAAHAFDEHARPHWIGPSSGVDVVCSATVVSEADESFAADFAVSFLEPSDKPGSLGRLGDFELQEVIGRSAMGIVLKGIQPELNRLVAVKVMAPHLATSGTARKRFAREAQAAAAIVHPHVMPIHSVNATGKLPYLVMPYVAGESLQQRLDRDGPLGLADILRIGLQTAEALAAAHAQGLVHRDVKPGNILLEQGVNRVLLADFGLARAVDDASLTRTGVIAGTPQFMSPEQAAGDAIDHRSDLFSLGSVLYSMAAGRPPFRSETTFGVLRRIRELQPRSIEQINPDIPQWLQTLIAKLHAKEPEERFQSAADVARVLEQCLAHVQQPAVSPLPASLSKRATSPVSRLHKNYFKGVIAMLVTIVFGLMGILAWEVTQPPDISGQWTGDEWGRVALKATEAGELEGTFTETIGKESGVIQLKWSRIERRYNGTWKDGDDRFGDLSVRLVADEIRGAFTTDAKSKINPATPNLSDLQWTRNSPVDQRNELTSAQHVWQMAQGRVAALKKKWNDGVATSEDVQKAKNDERSARNEFFRIRRQMSVDPASVNPADAYLRKNPTEQLAGMELKPFQGKWKLIGCDSQYWESPVDEAREWQWEIEKNEINWTGPSDGESHITFTIDSTRLPHEIDFTFLNGPQQGEVCRGVYEFKNEVLFVCLEDPGAKVGRPQDFSFAGDGGRSLIELIPAPPKTHDDEVEVLQGVWKFSVCQSQWWPVWRPTTKAEYPNWRWTVKGNEMDWTGVSTGDVKVSFTVDPNKSPKQIDFTFLDGPHKGEKCLGVYKLKGDRFWVCLEDPGAKVDRPTDFSYETYGGRSLLILDPVEPSIPPTDAKPNMEPAVGVDEDSSAAWKDDASERLRKLREATEELKARTDKPWDAGLLPSANSDLHHTNKQEPSQ